MDAEPNDATPFLPERHALSVLREAARDCHGCHLWRTATQTVFGEGLKRSRLMLVGERPGDREDRQGRPFVGPAGRELDQALVAALTQPSGDLIPPSGIKSPLGGSGRAEVVVSRTSSVLIPRSSTHPGGAVHGVSGRGATRALLHDRRMRPWHAPRPAA